MNNPFTITFGKEPSNYISRHKQTDEIIDNFLSEEPSVQAYMITGVRGSGKTVFLSNVARRIAEEKDWYNIELNPTRDMLTSLAAKIDDLSVFDTEKLDTHLEISALGLGVSVDKKHSDYDVETVLEKKIEKLSKKGKRLLITVDEVTNNEYVKEFASAFQILIRKGYSVFLIMTGLYENINLIQNNKALTFLYRTPKIVLEPLNITSVALSYFNILGVSSEQSRTLAELTKGYPFAYQMLGFLYWRSESKDMPELLLEYDQRLEEYVYEKIWDELSNTDREIVLAMAINENAKIIELRKQLGMSSGEFNIYRNRLIKKGVVATQGYGNLSLCLPRFAEIIKQMNGIIEEDNLLEKRDIAEQILEDLIYTGLSGQELLEEFHIKYSKIDDYKKRVLTYARSICK